MAESSFRLPGSLNVTDGNVTENFKKWKREFEVYMTATGSDEKDAKVLTGMIMAEREQGCEEATLSHTEAMEKFRQQLAEVVKTDPLLCDLPSEVTVEEINSQIALEYGQAMTVNVRRADDTVMGIVVTQTATVLDLKHAIRRHFSLRQKREGGKPHISWKYVWRRYWLYFDGQRMTEDHRKLKEYGVRNKDEITFVKRLKER